MPVQLTGTVHDYYDFKDGGIDEDELREGDVLIQPKLDAAGRYAVQGRRANLGYSGYYAHTPLQGRAASPVERQPVGRAVGSPELPGSRV